MPTSAIVDALLGLTEGDRVELTIEDYGEPAQFVVDERARSRLTASGTDRGVGTEHSLHLRPAGEGPHQEADGHRLIIHQYDDNRPAEASPLTAEVYDEDALDYVFEERGAVTGINTST